MYTEHRNNYYTTIEPVPLSNIEVSVVRMKTVETEYFGEPFTKCNHHDTQEYDITVCKTVKVVEAIIKTMVSHLILLAFLIGQSASL